jgi:hypothetical protein
MLIVAGQRPDDERRRTGRPMTIDHGSRTRLRAAAFRASLVYPGPVGELIAQELLSWDEFGHRLGGTRMIMALVEHVLRTPAAGAGSPPR